MGRVAKWVEGFHYCGERSFDSEKKHMNKFEEGNERRKKTRWSGSCGPERES
jgi:hypothetical protein